MSAPEVVISVGSDPCNPNPRLDCCPVQAMLEPPKKKRYHKKPGPALVTQTPLIDVTFWAKKSRVDQEQQTCQHDSGKEHLRDPAENTPTQAYTKGEEWVENAGGRDSEVIKEQIPLPKERPNHPRWNPKGSTIVRVAGRDIDLAALPECSCRPFFVNYQQRRIQHNRSPQDVSEESVEEAHRIWTEKEVACLFCRERYWWGFTRMRQIAL